MRWRSKLHRHWQRGKGKMDGLVISSWPQTQSQTRTYPIQLIQYQGQAPLYPQRLNESCVEEGTSTTGVGAKRPLPTENSSASPPKVLQSRMNGCSISMVSRLPQGHGRCNRCTLFRCLGIGCLMNMSASLWHFRGAIPSLNHAVNQCIQQSPLAG